MADDIFDLLVIGGGINGAGIAADAAGRGLNVFLAEAEDLASGTSSASSKLIHGGLRYLEQFEFRLVREALAEREILLAKAPHIVRPMRFVLPHVAGMRPGWLLRAGLFVYDHIAPRRALRSSASIDLADDPAGRALWPGFRRGFAYWDCWVDDARLVVANAMAARAAGATIVTRTPVIGLRAEGGLWIATLGGAAAGRNVAARAAVNAAGPWAVAVAGLPAKTSDAASAKLRLVKGSHIVVPRVRGAQDAYILQASDGRVVFALPFEGRFTLIGTTDEPFSGDPRFASASEAEVGYLLDVVNGMLARTLRRSDVVWTFAGVRPLEDDGGERLSAISRDYRLDLDASRGPPLLNVYGGKITTYRRLAGKAVDLLAPAFPQMRPALAAETPLPGGDLGGADFEAWFAEQQTARRGFAADALRRLARRYGARIDAVIGDARSFADLGADLGGGLTEREVAYLKSDEWAKTADDVLWRRTKAGLCLRLADLDGARERIDRVLH